jgi:hypothetical protein
MSVKTSVFGGITLSGEDAKAFKRQITYGRPKQAAQDAYKRGAPLVAEFNRKGYATIKPKKRG